MMVHTFIDEVKKAGGIVIKFWYPGISVCIKSARRFTFVVFQIPRA